MIKNKSSPEPIIEEIISGKGMKFRLLDRIIEVRYPLDIGKEKRDNKKFISVVIPDSRLKEKISMIILRS
jgi:hypothetical protein